MTITKRSYEELKEYWDFQRKIEYNKEKLKSMAKEMHGKVYNQMGMLSEQELFDSIWTKLPQEAYETPDPTWVPENEHYRFEWEKFDPTWLVKKLAPPGRKVVLRARDKFNEVWPEDGRNDS